MTRYPVAPKRMRLRGQNKLIREAHLAALNLSRVQASFETGIYLQRAIIKVKRIEKSLASGKYIPGAINNEH